MSLYNKLTPEQQDRALRSMGILRLLSSPDVEVLLHHDKVEDDHRLTEGGKERVFDALNYLRACFGVDIELVDAYLTANRQKLS